MKIRNKRIMTALVAVFAAVFLAGSAFALTARGPLVFQGTAAVDTTLQLVILNGPVPGTFIATHTNWTNVPTTAVASDVKGPGFSTVTISMDFSNVLTGRARVTVPVRNTGSVPVIIDDVNVDLVGNDVIYEFENGDVIRLLDLFDITTIWSMGGPTGLVINALDAEGTVFQPHPTNHHSGVVTIEFEFDATDFPGYSIIGELDFTVTVSYSAHLS